MTVDQAVNIISRSHRDEGDADDHAHRMVKTQDFTITRANIEVPIVKFEMKGNIAHISLEEFDETVDTSFL